MIMKKLKVFTFVPLVSLMLIPPVMLVFCDMDSSSRLLGVTYSVAIVMFFAFDRDGRFLFRNYIESLRIIREWILNMFRHR